MLAAGRILGWFQGRMEFGPARSGRDRSWPPRSTPMQARLNEIKDREDFRPVAPVVLAEKAADWFVADGDSPFMLFVYDVRDRAPIASRGAPRRRDGAHPDDHAAQNPLYYDLIDAFERRDRRAGAGQHLVQHARRADRLHAARRGRVLSGPRRSTRSSSAPICSRSRRPL